MLLGVGDGTSGGGMVSGSNGCGEGARVSEVGKRQEGESTNRTDVVLLVVWCGGRPGWRCSLPRPMAVFSSKGSISVYVNILSRALATQAEEVAATVAHLLSLNSLHLTFSHFYFHPHP